MKKLHLSVLLACFVTLFLSPAIVSGQTDSAAANTAIETGGAIAQPFIVNLAVNHPWILTALAAIASFRLLFKPIVSAIEMWVKSTPSTEDDDYVERIERSKAFKFCAWLLDYFASIKVGPQFTAKPKDS